MSAGWDGKIKYQFISLHVHFIYQLYMGLIPGCKYNIYVYTVCVREAAEPQYGISADNQPMQFIN